MGGPGGSGSVKTLTRFSFDTNTGSLIGKPIFERRPFHAIRRGIVDDSISISISDAWGDGPTSAGDLELFLKHTFRVLRIPDDNGGQCVDVKTFEAAGLVGATHGLEVKANGRVFRLIIREVFV